MRQKLIEACFFESYDMDIMNDSEEQLTGWEYLNTLTIEELKDLYRELKED